MYCVFDQCGRAQGHYPSNSYYLSRDVRLQVSGRELFFTLKPPIDKSYSRIMTFVKQQAWTVSKLYVNADEKKFGIARCILPLRCTVAHPCQYDVIHGSQICKCTNVTHQRGRLITVIFDKVRLAKFNTLDGRVFFADESHARSAVAANVLRDKDGVFVKHISMRFAVRLLFEHLGTVAQQRTPLPWTEDGVKGLRTKFEGAFGAELVDHVLENRLFVRVTCSNRRAARGALSAKDIFVDGEHGTCDVMVWRHWPA